MARRSVKADFEEEDDDKTNQTSQALKVENALGNLKWKVDESSGELVVWEQREGLRSKKRNGKVQGVRDGDCSPSTRRTSRSRTTTDPNDIEGPLLLSKCDKLVNRVTASGRGRVKRLKRGRDFVLKSTSAPKLKKVSPRVHNKSLDKNMSELIQSRGDGDIVAPEVSAKNSENMEPLAVLEALERLQAKLAARETKKLTVHRKYLPKRKGVAVTALRDNDFDHHEMRKLSKEKKAMRKPNRSKKRNSSTRSAANYPRRADGIQSLRYSTLETTPTETRSRLHPRPQLPRPNQRLQSLRSSTQRTTVAESTANGNHSQHHLRRNHLIVESAVIDDRGRATPAEKQGDSFLAGKKQYRSKSTSSALKIAADASGFVRTTLKAVEDARAKRRMHSEQEKLKSVNNQHDASKAIGSLRSKTTMSADTLIEEFGAIRLAAMGSAKEIARESRKAKKKARQLKNTMTTKLYGKQFAREVEATDLVPPDADIPKAIKLGRKVKKEIESQIKSYGLQENLTDQTPATKRTDAPPGGNKKKHSGFDRLIAGSSGDKEFQNALALAVAVVGDNEGQLWKKSQEENALKDAFYSTTKPPDEFWPDILQPMMVQKARGRSAEGRPTKAHDENHSALRAGSPTFCNDFPLSLSKSQKPIADLANRKILDAQKTIHDILRKQHRQAESDEAFGTEGFASNAILSQAAEAVVIIPDRVLGNDIDDKDVGLTNTTSHLPRPGTVDRDDQTRFPKVVLGGVDTPLTDKENRMPPNPGQRHFNSGQEHPGAFEVLKVKNSALIAGDRLHQRRHARRPSATFNKTNVHGNKGANNHVYLHSKDALDFGDTTLDAIQRAKQELRKVFLKTGNSGHDFFADEATHHLYSEPEKLSDFDSSKQHNNLHSCV